MMTVIIIFAAASLLTSTIVVSALMLSSKISQSAPYEKSYEFESKSKAVISSNPQPL